MGPDFSPKMTVKNLTSQQIVRIHQLFRQAKFDDPSGDVSYAFFVHYWILEISQWIVSHTGIVSKVELFWSDIINSVLVQLGNIISVLES